jgi:hypothetical protein
MGPAPQAYLSLVRRQPRPETMCEIMDRPISTLEVAVSRNGGLTEGDLAASLGCPLANVYVPLRAGRVLHCDED